MTIKLFTYSRSGCFRRCPKAHQFRYLWGWVPDKESDSIRLGHGWHAVKESADKGEDVEKTMSTMGTLDPYEMAVLSALHVVHEERWAGEALKVIATEKEFRLPLVNPDTSEVSQEWEWGGKIDRIYQLRDQRLVLSDHKLTSEDLSPDSDYWLRMSLDQQLGSYLLAARQLGFDISDILFDCVRRPALRPYKATPEDQKKFTKDGRLYANQRLADETPHEFVVRVAEALRNEPDRYFVRHVVARLDDDLLELQRDMWAQAQVIAQAEANNWHYRNTSACALPYRCSYLPVCGSKLNPEAPPEGYKRLENVHPELTATE